MGLTCTVLGASGYSASELLRLLAGHPALSVEGIAAGSHAGDPIGDLQPHLGAEGRFAPMDEVAPLEVDVLFSCLPAGTLSMENVGARVVVDLSDDHRWEEGWAYGLTEYARPSLPECTRIANPGCYPTASLLALLPFFRAGVVTSQVSIDAMSGLSGAGRGAKDHLLLAAAEGSVGAYGTTEHRHIPEIERSLTEWGGTNATVSFTPHLVPMSRGLLATARTPLGGPLSDEEALAALHSAYDEESFVRVTEEWPQTKAVRGSNHALVHARVDRRAGVLIASSAIDNLGKGAAGQAIQNANLALGIEEDAGLTGVGVWP